jgi:hypothetical protein
VHRVQERGTEKGRLNGNPIATKGEIGWHL